MCACGLSRCHDSCQIPCLLPQPLKTIRILRAFLRGVGERGGASIFFVFFFFSPSLCLKGGIVVAVTLAVLSGVLVRALWPAPAQVSAPSSCGVARNSTTTCPAPESRETWGPDSEFAGRRRLRAPERQWRSDSQQSFSAVGERRMRESGGDKEPHT